MNLRSDDRFVEGEGWRRAAERYENFLRTRAGGKMLFLELGVGYNTPHYHQIPFLANDFEGPKSHLCLHQSGTGSLPSGNRETVDLYQWGY